MAIRLLSLGTCAWIKTCTPGLQPRKLKRTLKESPSDAIEYQYPLVRLIPENFQREVNRITSSIRTKLRRHSIPTPWGESIRFVPHVNLEALSLDAQRDFDDFSALTRQVFNSWDSVYASAIKDLEAIAHKEYDLKDPYGFTDKKAWVKSFIEDITEGYPTKEDVQEDMALRIVLGDYAPAAVCPPGFHTISMVSWAEDYLEATLSPVRESLKALRKACTETDYQQAFGARLQAHRFPEHVHRMLSWAYYPDITLETMVEETLEYFTRMKSQLMVPRHEDIRRNMADLALKPLVYLANKKNIQDRLDYLLQPS